MSSSKVCNRKFNLCSDIRGVAVSGVEGEPINLTDPVAEAIAAAFASWLMDKRKQDGKRLRVSIGHDSRISSKQMQVFHTVDFFYYVILLRLSKQ